MEKANSYSSFGETCAGARDPKEGGQQERRVRNFEDVIESMGPPGRYQILQCLMINTNFIPVMFMLASYVFIGFQPPFSCSQVNETMLLQRQFKLVNESTPTMYQITYEECDIRVTTNASTSGPIKTVDKTNCCPNGYDYKGGDHVSIVTEWDLVCDVAGTAEIAQSIISIGWCIGITFASICSDKIGRKTTIAISTLLSSLFLIVSAFSPNIYVFIALRFFSGLVGPWNCSIAYVLVAELFTSKYREICSLVNGASISCSTLLLCAIAYKFSDHDWRDLQLCLGIVSMCPLLFLYFVDESASWLYSKGKYQRATSIIKRMCMVNGSDYETAMAVWDSMCAEENIRQESGQKSARSYDIFYIFRNEKLRFYAFIGWTLCFTNDTSYFGMLFTASTLSGNLYLNTTLMSLFEFPAFLMGLPILKYRGRRFTIIFFMSIAAVCLSISTCLQNVAVSDTPTQTTDSAATAFFIIGKMAIAVTYTVSYITLPELFPTTMRSSGMGVSVLGSCLGGIVAPYLLPLHGLVPWLPGVCLVILMVVCCMLVSRLPETKESQLPSVAM